MLTRLRRTAAGVAVIGGLAWAGPAAVTAHAPPAAAGGTYVVRRGDTLSTIALRLHTTVAALTQANGIRNAHRIRAGASLTIPVPPVPPVPTEVMSAPAGSPKLPDRLRRTPGRLALMPAFDRASREFKIPPDLLKATTWMESGWQNDKVSPTKALGIGQLQPITVRFVNEQLLRARLDPTKPEENIRLSARYLAWLLKGSNGNVPAALAGYYQGPTSVRQRGLFDDTKEYIADVIALRARFS